MIISTMLVEPVAAQQPTGGLLPSKTGDNVQQKIKMTKHRNIGSLVRSKKDVPKSSEEADKLAIAHITSGVYVWSHFTSQDEFDAWWKNANWKLEKRPKVDFSKSTLLVFSHDTANRSLAGGWIVTQGENGQYGVAPRHYLKLVWRPSDRVIFAFLELMQSQAKAITPNEPGCPE